MSDKSWLIFGLGGIGAVHALALHRAGCAVSAVARSNIDSVKQNPPSGNDRPIWDYVIVTTKALLNSSPSLPQLLEPFITDQATTIVLIQNGVGIEDGVRARWPKNTIISCVTWVGATQVSPGIVEHRATVKNEIGLFTSDLDPATEGEKLHLLNEAFTKGGMDVKVVDNIQIKRWEKVIWYAALGLDIPFEFIDTLMERATGLPLISSMQVDAANRRPMETEVIVGIPLRKAQELGISTPILRTLYALLIAKEKKYSSE
ncbi:hypothetical protein FRC09_008687 [Ceratobasidium sp. 395]|nr:hypothetical protein FRC09_008687 [Ceratobasidium sp. 395]